MSAYDYFLCEFLLPKDTVKKIISNSDSKIKLEPKYPSELCLILKNHVDCPLSVVRNNISKSVISIYLACTINAKKGYRIQMRIDEIRLDNDINVEMTSNNPENCDHGSCMNGRQLRGAKREDMKKILLEKKPKKVYMQSVLSLDKDLCALGNIDGYYTLGSLQNLRSEALASDDLAKNDLHDLHLEFKSQKNDNVEKFIHKIDLEPFSTIIFNEKNLDILRSAYKKNKSLMLNLDATGGILKKVNDGPLLHHVLLLPMKSNIENETHVLFNVAEMITEDQCSLNIENFLRLIVSKYSQRFKEEKLAAAVVTDKSFANINSIIKSFNNMTLRDYLSLVYKIFNGETVTTEPTYIFLCSSHLSKNMKKDIMRFFKKSKKDTMYFLCLLIGNLLLIDDYIILTRYIKLLIKLFSMQKESPEYYQVMRELQSLITVDSKELAKKMEAFEDINESQINDANKRSNEDENMKTIYGSSPFFKYFNKYYHEEAKNLKKPTEKVNDNEFYNVGFLESLLKNTISYLPLWSAVLHAKIQNTDLLRRPNNGFIESYFGSVKQEIRQNNSIGRFGCIKIGRYVRFIKEKQKGDIKKIELKLPEKRWRMKNSVTEGILSGSQEEWKKKTSRSSSIMFNPEKLKQKMQSKISPLE